MEGVAKGAEEPERAYRGFVALDDVSLQPMADGTGSADACHGKRDTRREPVKLCLCRVYSCVKENANQISLS